MAFSENLLSGRAASSGESHERLSKSGVKRPLSPSADNELYEGLSNTGRLKRMSVESARTQPKNVTNNSQDAYRCVAFWFWTMSAAIMYTLAQKFALAELTETGERERRLSRHAPCGEWSFNECSLQDFPTSLYMLHWSSNMERRIKKHCYTEYLRFAL